SGNLVVDGAATRVNFVGENAGTAGAGFTVGRFGSGTATISNGAIVTIDGTAVAPGNGSTGVGIGGNSSAGGGTGTLNITSGAKVTVAGNVGNSGISVGRDATGAGPSNGTLNITSGGQLLVDQNGKGSIGVTANSTGAATVTGAG